MAADDVLARIEAALGSRYTGDLAADVERLVDGAADLERLVDAEREEDRRRRIRERAGMRSELARDYLRALEQCAIDVASMPREDAETFTVIRSVERQLLEHVDRDEPDPLELGALFTYWRERLDRHRAAFVALPETAEGGASS
jgi:hypothetical protein